MNLFFSETLSPSKIESRLLKLAAIFIFLYSLILTLAPAAREHSWAVEYHWSNWLGFTVWGIVFVIAHFQIRHWLPDADPYLLPIAALLTGWGVLTIWRLQPSFGIRQAAWLLVIGVVLFLGVRLPANLNFLRRYKYLWLICSLLLTTLTLFFGTNPSGGSERLWLGGYGVYFQPSEPLKLLLIVFLAAYLSDRLPFILHLLPLLAPTAIVTGLALLLLIIQRDLGTTSIFIFIYTIVLFVASGKKRVLWISLIGLALAGVAGYFLFDVVSLRVNAWLNPWLDPSGRSYQVVQSLLAIANGGLIGRGPGMGSPGLVPVAISDFAFSAIAEETGLVGTLGLLAVIGVFTARGLHVALHASDRFRRILAAGLTAYLSAQSLLIIGGNLRLFPLTGVTLPFISYGGSSLLTSFFALLLLLLTSSQPEDEPAPLPNPQPYLLLAVLLGVGIFTAALTNGWWAIWRGPELLTRTDNARRSIADRYVRRGSLFDRHETVINISRGESGTYVRYYLYPDLSPISGYTDPIYGQAGLEASLDPYLRGLNGNPASLIWLDHLLYGQPPPGLDVRLSIDLDMQRQADTLLGAHSGVIVLLNAESGEIMVMASHPTFNPDKLGTEAQQLSHDPQTPLLNRAAQGMYLPGDALTPFFQAAGFAKQPSKSAAEKLFEGLGFYTAPNLRLPVASVVVPGSTLRISPLQMALAVAALTHNGLRPSPRLAMAVKTPVQGWVILPPMSEPVQALPSEGSHSVTEALVIRGEPFWQYSAQSKQDQKAITWYLSGTLPDWQGSPLALVVVLEEDPSTFAKFVGQTVLKAATQP